MCDIVLSEDPFMLVYGTGKYKTQRVCDEAWWLSNSNKICSLLVCYK